MTEPTEAALRAAMAGAGLVTLACDGVIKLSSTLTNQGNTTIDGTGHQVTISGSNVVRVFLTPTNFNLTLLNLAVTEGYDPRGAGVFNDGGILTLVGVVISSNRSVTVIPAGPDGPVAAAGAAVYNLAGTVLATNCTFQANQAIQPIAADSPWKARGGAIFNDTGTVILDHTLLVQNRAVGGDGLSVGSPAYNPGVAAYGGAIYSTGPLWVNECTLRENLAKGGSGNSNETWVGPGAPGAEALGGAIWSQAALVVERSTFARNACVGGAGGNSGLKNDPLDTSGETGGAGGNARGGALCSLGNLAVNGSTFISNTVTGGQGGKGGTGGQWSTMAIGEPGGPGGKSGSAEGSALANGGLASFVNCTFAGNLAVGLAGGQGGAGGVSDRVTAPGGRGGSGGSGGAALGAISDPAGLLRSTNCTLAYNAATAGNGAEGGPGGKSGYQYSEPFGPPGPNGTNGAAVAGLQSAGGLLINTLLGRNEPGGNCLGTVADAGHNLSSEATPVFTNTGSVNLTDPKLGALADNGGPTLTIALLAGSPAIGAADAEAAPSQDQRGVHRPLGTAADIGAYEYTFLNLIAPAWRTDGAYVFDVQGESGETFVIEGSSDLLNWTPLHTNVLSGGAIPFMDAGAGKSTLRWYRAVLLP